MVFHPKGTCAKVIFIDLNEDKKIKAASVIGGCEGNSKAVCKLITGMDAKEAIEKLSGIRCGSKETSCPDQIAKCLMEIIHK